MQTRRLILERAGHPSDASLARSSDGAEEWLAKIAALLDANASLRLTTAMGSTRFLKSGRQPGMKELFIQLSNETGICASSARCYATGAAVRARHYGLWLAELSQRLTTMKRVSALSPVILCVDDHQPGLEVRQMLLERAGYFVLTAMNGFQALQLFRSQDVDLAIVDHTLQDRTAPELMRRMKRLRPYVPIMVYSGATEVPDLSDADVFVSKLEPTADVLGVIESLLAEHSGLAEDLPKAA